MFLRLRDNFGINVNEILYFGPIRKEDAKYSDTKSLIFMKPMEKETVPPGRVINTRMTYEVPETVDEIFTALREQGFLPNKATAAFTAASEGGAPSQDKPAVRPSASNTGMSPA